MEEIKNGAANPFSTQPVGRLILKFAIPCVIALVVNSLYNIVDQIFIGVDGVLWSGPIADGLAFILVLAFIIYEIRKLKNMRFSNITEKSKINITEDKPQ